MMPIFVLVAALLAATVSANSKKEHRTELILIDVEKIGEKVTTPRPKFDRATVPDTYDLRALGLLTTDLNQVCA